jgi:hypothetical protein
MRAARMSGIALYVKHFLLRKYSNARFDAERLEKFHRLSRNSSGAIIPIDGNEAGS